MATLRTVLAPSTSALSSFAFSVFACALVVTAAPALAQNDEIVKTDGGFIRGVEVLGETLREVTYKRGNSEEKIPSSEVTEIVWRDAPDSYARAQIALEGGDLETAANLFAEAADRGKTEAFKASARFKAVDTLVKAAGASPERARTAAQAAQRWVDSHGQHRLALEALQLLGRAHMIAGDGDAALAAFKKLEELVTSNALGSLWIGRAKFGQGQAQMAKKDFRTARTTFTAAYTVTSMLDPKEYPGAKQLSVQIKVAQGECYLEEGNYREAESFFQQLNSLGAEHPAFRTASLCGVGHALYEQGKKDKDVAKLRSAQMKFAEVSATDITDGDTSAKALYFLAQTLLALGSDKEGDGVSTRAIGIFRQVAESYPDSRWALLARRELGS